MGLGAAFNSWSQGEFKEGFNFLFVDEAVMAQDQKTTQGLIAVTEQRELRGVISPSKANELKAQILLDGDYRKRFEIPELSPAGEFAAGIRDGASNIRGAISETTGFSASLIPWQIWALVGVMALFYALPLLLSLRQK